MSENTNEVELPQEDEATTIKNRLNMMGVKYHHKPGVEKLRNILKDALTETVPVPAEHTPPPLTDVTNQSKTVLDYKDEFRKDAAKLLRVMIVCSNPSKRDWEGEIYTVSNAIAGTYRKYIPFNNAEGWHIPNIMYQTLKEKQCQVFYTERNNKGTKIRKGKLIPEYNITVMPPLTYVEIKNLAMQQAMREGKESEL